MDLLEPRRVALDPDRLGIDDDREIDAARVHEVLDRVGCVLHHRAEVEHAAPKLDLVLRDAARLQEVVEQARHLRGLTLEDLDDLLVDPGRAGRRGRSSLSSAVAWTIAPRGCGARATAWRGTRRACARRP